MKYDFFVPESGSIIRPLTLPYQYYCHKHILDLEWHPCYENNDCIQYCTSDFIRSKFTISRGWMIGILSLNKNEKKILKMDRFLFEKLRAYNLNYGDPTKYNFDIQFNDGKLEIVIIKDSNDGILKKDLDLSEECLRLVDPIEFYLSNISSSEEFKNFYMLCKMSKSNKIIDLLINCVDEKYVQYKNTLKTLLVFS